MHLPLEAVPAELATDAAWSTAAKAAWGKALDAWALWNADAPSGDDQAADASGAEDFLDGETECCGEDEGNETTLPSAVDADAPGASPASSPKKRGRRPNAAGDAKRAMTASNAAAAKRAFDARQHLSALYAQVHGRPPPLAEGSVVVLHGLGKMPELNDRGGTLVSFNASTGRWECTLDDGATSVKVKPENIRLAGTAAPTPSPTLGSAGDKRPKRRRQHYQSSSLPPTTDELADETRAVLHEKLETFAKYTRLLARSQWPEADRQLVFSHTLSGLERKYVHEVAAALGLAHWSTDGADGRAITVAKVEIDTRGPKTVRFWGLEPDSDTDDRKDVSLRRRRRARKWL